MTNPDPAWNLLKAAEAVALKLEDLRLITMGSRRFLSSEVVGALDECDNGRCYLREAITAYKEAKNETAS
jgi:hypothetical protein